MKLPYKRPSDPELAQLYDAINEVAQAQVTTSEAPGLITAVPTFAELRKTPGDVTGAAGPPAITVSGIKAPGDNGAAMTFAWKPGDARDDNNGDNSTGDGIVAVVGIDRGRWTRAQAVASVQTLTAGTGISLTGPAATPTISNTGVISATAGTGLTNSGTATAPVFNVTAAPGKTLIRRSVITGNTTLGKATGTTFATWRMVGGGGGGGGCGTTGLAGGGGSAGGYAEGSTATIPSASWSIAIGAAGTAGVSGASQTDGGAGGNTTISNGTTTTTAFGGPGGVASTSTTQGVSVAGGAAPAVSTNGDVNSSGEPGGRGINLTTTACVTGQGGSGPFGAGGRSKSVGSAGDTGIGYGAGGSGASVSSSNGGAGTAGILILEEWG